MMTKETLSALSRRSPTEVFEDHLQQSLSGTMEEDFARNYAEDVVLLTGYGLHRGHAGLRHLTELLRAQLPQVEFRYLTRLVDGEMAFLEWSAISPRAQVTDGADSYLIRDGRIAAQTIHYTVMPLS